MEEQQKPPSTNPYHFQPGKEKTGGRQPGVRNRTTRMLKEAIIMAAECEGSDSNGKDGLVGFLRRVANEDIRAFASLLGRVLPLQVETKNDTSVEGPYQTVEEARRELEASGITFEMVKEIFHQPMEATDDLNVVKLNIKH
jgi:hypothetical protein